MVEYYRDMKLNEPRESEKSRWSKKMLIESHECYGRKLSLPSSNTAEQGVYSINLPKDIWEHKLYPTCICGRKFVRMKHIKGCDKNCLWCVLKKC